MLFSAKMTFLFSAWSLTTLCVTTFPELGQPDGICKIYDMNIKDILSCHNIYQDIHTNYLETDYVMQYGIPGYILYIASAKQWYIICIIFLVLLSGITAGLTIGLMALDETNLAILQRSGSKKEVEYASKIIPIRKNTYLLLCTLLVANVIINETLPILIDRVIIGGWKAVIISSLLLLLFAEILPQAFFTKFGLAACANLVWLIEFFILVIYPISYPLSCMIGYLIGKKQKASYKREQLRELVNYHMPAQLTADEVKIIIGVLDMNNKFVGKSMIPKECVYSLDSEMVLDYELLTEIYNRGYSRIPLYRGTKSNIVSILLSKKLLIGKSLIGTPLRKLPNSIPYFISSKRPIFDAFMAMKDGQTGHLAIVQDENSLFIGIITLEDIIEELLQNEIVDETDEYIDVSLKSVVPQQYKTDSHIISTFLSSKIASNSLGLQPLDVNNDSNEVSSSRESLLTSIQDTP